MTNTLKSLQTGLKLAVFTLFSQTILIEKVFKWKPVPKPNLNRLFIGCFEKKPAVLSGKQYTSKDKKSTKFIFKQIFKHCFRGIFKN